MPKRTRGLRLACHQNFLHSLSSCSSVGLFNDLKMSAISPNPAVTAEPVPVQLEVTVPGDWQPGKSLSFTHNGKRYEAPVPEGRGPGSTFRISLTDALSKVGDKKKSAKRKGKMLMQKRPRGRPRKEAGSFRKPTASERKQERMRADDNIMRETLRKFFSGHGRGRTPEHIRKIMDAVLTIFAMNPDIDRKFMDRYLAFPTGRMTDRFRAARRRADHNASLVGPQKAAQWKWFDPPARRSDAYSQEMRDDAAAFWRVRLHAIFRLCPCLCH